ncbi:MAG: hypothetical protein LUF27_05080 [Lachnospiraceae bacterium]|nr:hypothetical protein [Lachnospiraceae bacterium]
MKKEQKEIRKRIREMKGRMTPEQVFLSPRYQELVRKLTREITDGKFSNVSIRCLGGDTPAGTYDGERIVVNLDYELLRSYASKEMMNLGIIGIVGHECGHKNYSDIYLRGKYLQGIRMEHKLYPHAPVPRTGADKKALQDIKECFQDGDTVVISYVHQIAAFLGNLLEDRYIEEKMCRDYPGSIRSGIRMNRMRMLDLFPSVKTMEADGQPMACIMLNVIAQYLFAEKYNAWDGVAACYVECLEACRPLLGAAVLKDGESVRYELTNQILLKLWQFIRADTDKIREEIAGNEKEHERGSDGNPEKLNSSMENSDSVNAPAPFNELNSADEADSSNEREPESGAGSSGFQEQGKLSEKQDEDVMPDEESQKPGALNQKLSKKDFSEAAEQAAEKRMQCLPSYSHEPEAAPDNGYPDVSEVTAGDADWDGCWNDGDGQNNSEDTESRNGDADDLENTEFDNDGSAAGKSDISNGLESMSQENAGLQAGFADDYTQNPDDVTGTTASIPPQSDASLLSFLSDVAKELVEQEDEERLHQKLSEVLKRTDFGSSHESVRKAIFRNAEVSDEAVQRYLEAQKEVRKIRRKLETDLLPYLEKRRDHAENGLLLGRRMDIHSLYRPDQKAFEKKIRPGCENDTVVALLLDLSASMKSGNRIAQARFAALCLYEFCQEADIPVTVYGHYTGRISDQDSAISSEEVVCLESMAEFDFTDGKDGLRIMDASPKGANRDGAAIRFMGRMLLERPERKKILALVSDGLPNAENYSGESARKDLMEIKEKLTAEGITFLAAAIADDREAIRGIYGDAYVDISDIRKLPQKLMKQIIKIL